FFFFQAEDGIRDRNVTGVQTCALPIFYRPVWTLNPRHPWNPDPDLRIPIQPLRAKSFHKTRKAAGTERLRFRQAGDSSNRWRRRSEERRVGKECRCGWSEYS